MGNEWVACEIFRVEGQSKDVAEALKQQPLATSFFFFGLPRLNFEN